MVSRVMAASRLAVVTDAKRMDAPRHHHGMLETTGLFAGDRRCPDLNHAIRSGGDQSSVVRMDRHGRYGRRMRVEFGD